LLVLTFFSLFLTPSFEVRAVKVKYGFPSVDAHVDLDTGDLTLYRWNREAYFKISTGQNKKNIRVANGVVTVDYGSLLTVKIYEVNVDEGGVEYEAILKEKPPVNSISFPIDTKNLNWFYQPPLDQELNVSAYNFVNATHAIKDGVVVNHRPLNVVGSYAVYHAYKRDNEYKTGKAFHLYRPHAVDAEGRETWLDLRVEKGKLTITINQEFLDAAAYPITIDPTFGYTTAGASWITDITYAYGYRFTGSAGTATEITAYIKNTNELSSEDAAAAIYKQSDETYVVGTGRVSIPADSTDWRDFDIADTTIYDEDYYLFIWSDSHQMQIAYDTGTSGYRAMDPNMDETSFPNWPSTALTSMFTGNEKLSIYCTYTAGGGGQEYTRTASQSLTSSWTAARTLDVNRAGTQTLTFSWTASRLTEMLRSVTQSLSVGLSASRVAELTRSASQVLTTVFGADRAAELKRSAVQTLTTVFGASRLAEISRAVTQSFTFSVDAGKIAGFFRTAGQSLTFAFSSVRQINIARTVSEALSFTFSSERLIDIARTVSQAVSFIVEGVGKGISSYTRSAGLTLIVRGWGQTPTWVFDMVTPLTVGVIIALPVIVGYMLTRRRR